MAMASKQKCFCLTFPCISCAEYLQCSFVLCFLILNIFPSPEYDTLQVKRVFNDARGGDSNPQHILLSGKVGWLGDPVQRVQVTTHTEGEN